MTERETRRTESDTIAERETARIETDTITERETRRTETETMTETDTIAGAGIDRDVPPAGARPDKLKFSSVVTFIQ